MFKIRNKTNAYSSKIQALGFGHKNGTGLSKIYFIY